MNVNCGPLLPAGENISPFYHTYLPRRVLSADECSVLHRIENKLSYRPRSKSKGTQPAIFVAAHSSYLSCEPKQKKILWLKNYHIRKKSIFLLPCFFQCHPDVVRMLCFLSLGGWAGGSCQLGRSALAGSCQIGRIILVVDRGL